MPLVAGPCSLRRCRCLRSRGAWARQRVMSLSLRAVTTPGQSERACTASEPSTSTVTGTLWVIDNARRVLKFLRGSMQDSQPVYEYLVGAFMTDVSVDDRGRVYVYRSGTSGGIDVIDPGLDLVVDQIPTDNGGEPSIAVLPDGVYFIRTSSTDNGVYRVRFDAGGDLVREPDGSVVPELVVPAVGLIDIAAGPSGDLFVSFSTTAGDVWRFNTDELPLGPYDPATRSFERGAVVARTTGTIVVDAANNVFINTSINRSDNPSTTWGVAEVPPPGPDGVPMDDSSKGGPKQYEVLGIVDLFAAGLESPDCTNSFTPPGVICTGGTAATRRIAVDGSGDLFVPSFGTFALAERNVVFRVEGVGAAVPTPDPVELCLSDAVVVEGDAPSPGQIVMPITLSESLMSDVVVTFTADSGTAVVGSGSDADVIGGSGSFTLFAGTNAATLSLNVVGDEFAEADETFTVRLASATSPGAVSTCSEATGTIRDDDDPDDHGWRRVAGDRRGFRHQIDERRDRRPAG